MITEKQDLPVLSFDSGSYHSHILLLQKIVSPLQSLLSIFAELNVGEMTFEDIPAIVRDPSKFYLERKFNGTTPEINGVRLSWDGLKSMVEMPAQIPLLRDAAEKVQHAHSQILHVDKHPLPRTIIALAEFFAVDELNIVSIKEHVQKQIKEMYQVRPLKEDAIKVFEFAEAVLQLAKDKGIIEMLKSKRVKNHSDMRVGTATASGNFAALLYHLYKEDEKMNLAIAPTVIKVLN